MRAKACFPKIVSESVRIKILVIRKKGLSASVEGLFLLLRGRFEAKTIVFGLLRPRFDIKTYVY